MELTFNYESLYRHGVSEEECEEIYWDGEAFPLSPSERGNDRKMLVGIATGERFIEIGVEHVSEEHDHIFHADRATRTFRNLYMERRK